MFKKIIKWLSDLFEMNPAVADRAEKKEPLKAKPVEKTTVINNYYGSTPNQAINRSAREKRPVQNVYEYRGDDRRNDSNLTDAITTGVIAGVTSAIVEEVIDSYQHNDTQSHYVEPNNIVEETVYQEPIVEEKVDSVSFVGFDSSKTIDEPVYNTRYESEPVTSSYDNDDSGSWGGGSDSGD